MTTMLLIFLIAMLGYFLGRGTIAGLNLGTSGVLIVALVFGHFGFEVPSVVRDLGLVLFVTAVGFIAGPVFFRNFKAKAASYVILGVLTIVTGAALCVLVIKVFGIPSDLSVGMMTGALTSTPGLAAAMEATGSDAASIGYGIAYPFGVVGVVLFVQLVPKLLKADIAKEVAKIDLGSEEDKLKEKTGLFEFDGFGLFAYSVAVVLGLLIAKISIPLPGGASFSLGTSGGPLLTGLLMGHFRHIGKVNITVGKQTLETLRELGLMLFLIGAGTNAGNGFVEILSEYGLKLFFLGALITIIPMVVSYFVARKVLKLEMFNTLGSICGGMTSTPALGTLIGVAKSDAVAASYAATYPVALIFVVLASQFIAILL